MHKSEAGSCTVDEQYCGRDKKVMCDKDKTARLALKVTVENKDRGVLNYSVSRPLSNPKNST